jgi:nitrogen fixation/metabolism regulation signal transduction histidine kinase
VDEESDGSVKGSPKALLPWRRSLRARLTLLFAALGLVPALVVGYAVLSDLTRSVDVWENPGVTATMESVRLIARTSVDKLVGNLAAHARNVVTEGFIADVGREPDRAASRLENLHTQSEVDLVALFVEAEGGWRSISIACDDSISLTDTEIRQALQFTSLQTRSGGYLVSAFPFEAGGAPHVLLLGYRLGPEYIPNLESIAAGLTYYNQLRLAKQATRRSALLTAVVVTLLALGVAAVAGQWVARGVSRPVENLVQGMQQLARGEPVRVSPSGTDELRFLTEAFNRMAQELDATRRELGRAERLAAWQEMARRIAHEIRNPLTPIQFALHRLQRMADSGRPPAPEAIQDSVSAILEEIEGLKTLAAAFSEFARLPDPEPVALQPNELVRSVAELADGQGARITLALADDLPEIEGDRKGLRRVLTNLLRNALDSGAEEIIVRTRTSDGLGSGERLGDGAQLGPGSVRSLLGEPHVVVTVEDTGPGVDADKLDQIFEPDYTTKPDGSGLGLAIVCRIVAQHGGALVVEPGHTRGIRMHVHLPLSRPDGMA